MQRSVQHDRRECQHVARVLVTELARVILAIPAKYEKVAGVRMRHSDARTSRLLLNDDVEVQRTRFTQQTRER